MLIPVLCFTCGYPIGEIDDLFRTMRNRRVEKTLATRKTVPTQAAVDAGLQVDCSDDFETLGIRFDCCRKSLVSGMIFSDFY